MKIETMERCDWRVLLGNIVMVHPCAFLFHFFNKNVLSINVGGIFWFVDFGVQKEKGGLICSREFFTNI